MPTKKTATKSKKAAPKRTKKATAKKASPAAKKTSPAAKKTSTSAKKKAAAGDQEITIDRRTQADRRKEKGAAPQLERREKVQRRRQIDPTTCERDYSDDEVRFMNAMDEYKRTSGRMFPTCSEVLEVIRGLGYVLLTPAEIAAIRPEKIESAADTGGEQSELEGAESEAEAVAG